MDKEYETRARQALADALAAYAGQGHGEDARYKTLAEQTGVDIRRLYLFKERGADVRWFEVFALADALGPEFINALLEPLNISGAFRVDQQAAAFDVARLATRYAEEFTEAISDGVFDHSEKAALEPLIIKMIVAGAATLNQRSTDRIKVE